MALVSHTTAVASWKKKHGETEFARRKELAVKTTNRVERWLKTEEGLELEPDTDGAIQFYRHRILQIAMTLSETNVERLPKKHPLALLVYIQKVVREGLMV